MNHAADMSGGMKMKNITARITEPVIEFQHAFAGKTPAAWCAHAQVPSVWQRTERATMEAHNFTGGDIPAIITASIQRCGSSSPLAKNLMALIKGEPNVSFLTVNGGSPRDAGIADRPPPARRDASGCVKADGLERQQPFAF
jgi:hypothetical protein